MSDRPAMAAAARGAELRLYIAGDSTRSQSAERALRELCTDVWPEDFTLDVIDVLERPDLANDAHVLATPLVVKSAPGTERRVVGDLSDRDRLARALGVAPAPETTVPTGGDHR